MRAPLLGIAALAAAGLTACGRGVVEIPTPSELSTGPVLQWTEQDLGLESALFVEATSDGRVVLAGGMRGATFAARVTDDGESWSTLPLPDGVVPLDVDAGGDRWVLIGAPPGIHPNDADIFGAVFVTDDDGASWTKATLASLPDEGLPDYASSSKRVVEVFTSGDQTVAAVLTFSRFDLESLLTDQGRIPAGARMSYWVPDEDSISARFRGVGSDDGVSDETEINWTYAELSLSPEQVDVVDNVESDARIHLFAGEGPTLAHVASFGGSDAVGRWTDSGFVVLTDDWSHVTPQPQAPQAPAWEGVMLVVTLDDLTTQTSPDGRTWLSRPFVEYSDGTNREGSTVGPTGTVWSSWREGSGEGRVRITRETGDQSPVETAEFHRLNAIEPLEAGPAGLAAMARLAMRDGWSFARTGRVIKGGYELRYDEPRGGVTLWDLGSDESVYEFESRIVEGLGTPDGTHQQGDGLSYTLTFDDPEAPGEHVEFDAFDLQSVFGRCWWTSRRPGVFVERQAAQRGWAPGMFPDFWPWVGWSADGVDWGWQALPEALDTCDASADISLAVGTDYVVALLQPSTPSSLSDVGVGDDSGETASTAPRLYVAHVP